MRGGGRPPDPANKKRMICKLEGREGTARVQLLPDVATWLPAWKLRLRGVRLFEGFLFMAGARTPANSGLGGSGFGSLDGRLVVRVEEWRTVSCPVFRFEVSPPVRRPCVEEVGPDPDVALPLGGLECWDKGREKERPSTRDGHPRSRLFNLDPSQSRAAATKPKPSILNPHFFRKRCPELSLALLQLLRCGGPAPAGVVGGQHLKSQAGLGLGGGRCMFYNAGGVWYSGEGSGTCVEGCCG